MVISSCPSPSQPCHLFLLALWAEFNCAIFAAQFRFNWNDFLKIIPSTANGRWKRRRSSSSSWDKRQGGWAQPNPAQSYPDSTQPNPLPIIQFPIWDPLETLAHKLIGWCRFLCRLSLYILSSISSSPSLLPLLRVVVVVAACLFCEFHKRMRCLVACVINKSSILRGEGEVGAIFQFVSKYLSVRRLNLTLRYPLCAEIGI